MSNVKANIDPEVQSSRSKFIAIELNKQVKGADSESTDRLLGYYLDKGQLKYLKVIFLFVGMAGYINWHTTTNCIQTVYATVFDSPESANTMLIPYLIASITTTLARLYYKNISLVATSLGIFILLLTNIAIPTIIQFSPKELGAYFLHLAILFVGVGVSLVQGNFAAYAFLMPYNFFSVIMAGSSLAGLTAFLVWQALVRLFFDSSDLEEIRNAVWVYYICNVCLIFSLAGIFIFLIKKPWFKGSIQIFNETKHIKLDPNETNSKAQVHVALGVSRSTRIGMRSLRNMVWQSIPFLVMSGLSFSITYAIFPNIGPYGWVGSYDNRSFLVGIYQILDLIGRNTPNLGKAFLLPIKLSACLIVFRLVFIPIWLLMASFESGIASNFTFQIALIIIFALLSGYLTILPLVHVGKGLLSVAERGYMGMFNFFITQIWLCTGILTSNILIILFNIQY